MVNEQKIVTMTQLALYDKHEGPQDRADNDYFRHDYIYRNNLGTRLAVGIGGIIILAVYWLQVLIVNEIDIFTMDIQAYVTDSVMFLLAILAVYSLIGSIQGTRQYYLVQKRLSQYQALVRQLERLEERSRRAYEDEEDEMPPRRQDDIAATRAHSPGPLVRTTPPPRTAPPPRPRPGTADYPRPPRPEPRENIMPPPDGGIPLPKSMPEDTRPPRPLPKEGTRPPRPMPQDTRPPRRRPLPITEPPAGRTVSPIEHTQTHERPLPRVIESTPPTDE